MDLIDTLMFTLNLASQKHCFYTEFSLREALFLHLNLTETLFLRGFALFFADALIFFKKFIFILSF